MPFKTIIAHCDGARSVSHRLAVAAELAGHFDAVLVGVHAKPPFQAPLYAESSLDLGPLFELYERDLEAARSKAHAAYEEAVKGRHLTTEWRQLDGRVDDVLALCARYADLVVVGQSDSDDGWATPADLPESVALASGKPVLVVPRLGVAKSVGNNVMLCWNASRESARAATDALPFLTAAKQVIVLLVEPRISNAGHGPEPGADVASWLARHGVKVTVQREVAPDEDVGKVILSRAADHGTDLIAMGLYGHSRLRETVLGGVSRSMLSTTTVPILMSH